MVDSCNQGYVNTRAPRVLKKNGCIDTHSSTFSVSWSDRIHLLFFKLPTSFQQWPLADPLIAFGRPVFVLLTFTRQKERVSSNYCVASTGAVFALSRGSKAVASVSTSTPHYRRRELTALASVNLRPLHFCLTFRLSLLILLSWLPSALWMWQIDVLWKHRPTQWEKGLTLHV